MPLSLHRTTQALRKVPWNYSHVSLPSVLLHVKSGLLDPPHLEQKKKREKNYLMSHNESFWNQWQSWVAYPSWSIAMTLNRLARASKLRKKKPWEAPYPWTMTRVGDPSLASKETVLMYLDSLLEDLNHLTLEPGGPEPMLTCSCTYRVLKICSPPIKIETFRIKKKNTHTHRRVLLYNRKQSN